MGGDDATMQIWWGWGERRVGHTHAGKTWGGGRSNDVQVEETAAPGPRSQASDSTVEGDNKGGKIKRKPSDFTSSSSDDPVPP